MGRRSSGAPGALPTGSPAGRPAGDTYHVLRGLELPDGATFAAGDVVTAADLGEYLEHFRRREAVVTPEELERRQAGEAVLAAVDEALGDLGFTDEELALLMAADDDLNAAELGEADTAVDAPEGQEA